jgi:hypothetical protein
MEANLADVVIHTERKHREHVVVLISSSRCLEVITIQIVRECVTELVVDIENNPSGHMKVETKIERHKEVVRIGFDIGFVIVIDLILVLMLELQGDV